MIGQIVLYLTSIILGMMIFFSFVVAPVTFKLLNEENSRNHEVTKKMGYISNVEDVRKKLEDLFKDT